MSITFVFLKPEMRYVIRDSGKGPFVEMLVGRNVLRGAVLWENVLSGKCTFGEVSFGELSVRNCLQGTIRR